MKVYLIKAKKKKSPFYKHSIKKCDGSDCYQEIWENKECAEKYLDGAYVNSGYYEIVEYKLLTLKQ